MIIALGLIGLFVVFALIQIAWVMFNGKQVARPEVVRTQATIGKGESLRYVILGDSTAVSQGGEYQQGYAVATAQYLAKSREVTWMNVGVPGARAKDVFEAQIPQAAAFKPDVALIAVGANDVTHLTATSSVKDALQKAIAQLRRVNPQVVIVLTGSPDMGSVPRFPQPLRWLAGERTEAINAMVETLTKEEGVLFAPIARETGPEFRANPALFAVDKFHPTTKGYILWSPVIIDTLSRAGL